jgi:hypothetical protein
MTGANFSALTTQASGCVTRAESRIDSVLARRYDLTQNYFQTYTSCPPVIREWTIQLASGFLWQELARAGAGKEAMARGKGLIDGVYADLKDLRDHNLELVDTTGALIVDASTGVGRVMCNTTNYTPTFAEDDELNWTVDSDKLEDISSARD